MNEPNQPSGPTTQGNAQGAAPNNATPTAPVNPGIAETAPGRGRKTQPPKWNMDLILDVQLGVTVSFGETQMPLREVVKLGVGSVVELDRGVNDPVTILVNDKPIATGEVVVVEGNYGVKVLAVESTADRIRSLA